MEPNPYEAPQHSGQRWPEKKSQPLVPVPKIDLPPALQVAILILYVGGLMLLAGLIIGSLR